MNNFLEALKKINVYFQSFYTVQISNFSLTISSVKVTKSQKTGDSVTFTDGILNRKFHILCSATTSNHNVPANLSRIVNVCDCPYLSNFTYLSIYLFIFLHENSSEESAIYGRHVKINYLTNPRKISLFMVSFPMVVAEAS